MAGLYGQEGVRTDYSSYTRSRFRPGPRPDVQAIGTTLFVMHKVVCVVSPQS